MVIGPPSKPFPVPTELTPPPELRSGAQVRTPLLILRTCPSGPGPGLRLAAVTAPSITLAALIELARRGEVKAEAPAEAIAKYDLSRSVVGVTAATGNDDDTGADTEQGDLGRRHRDDTA